MKWAKRDQRAWKEFDFDFLCSICAGTGLAFASQGSTDERNDCTSCVCTGRDAVPWAELFRQGVPK